MTERIDHTAQAIELDEVAAEHLATDEFAYADMALKAAQMHATLALVEQQRIANLIAIYSATAEVEEGFTSAGVDFGQLSSEIGEALGLT